MVGANVTGSGFMVILLAYSAWHSACVSWMGWVCRQFRNGFCGTPQLSFKRPGLVTTGIILSQTIAKPAEGQPYHII